MAAKPPLLKMPDKITEDEKNSFRLIKMAFCTARYVLYTIFLWGTLQSQNQTLEDYLLNTKVYTMTKYKNCFNNMQRQKMTSRDLESKFDISHLYKAIIHACDKVNFVKVEQKDPNSLEWLINAIKDFRNEVSHSMLGITKETMMEKIDVLRNLLEKALDTAGLLYNRDPADIRAEIDTMNKDIKYIRDQPLAQTDISEYEIDLLNEKHRAKLGKEGLIELKEKYKNWSQINPVSFLEGERMHLRVSTVFTQIEVEAAGRKFKGSIVPYENVLSLCMDNAYSKTNNNINAPVIFLIEGPAGSGKTTLTKLMMSEWCTGGGSMQGLNEYELLLYMECRNLSISNFPQLLSQLMPRTNARYFKEGDLLKYTLDLKTLLIVDGLDEMNSKSEELFMDIINQRVDNLVVLCTSRPEKVPYFQTHIPHEYRIAHLKITGVADNKREEFIRKYHDEMLRQGLSTGDTEEIVEYVKKSEIHLQKHYRLPLNLVVLVWLWADDKARINAVTTSSELYFETHKLMKRKLTERLAHNEATKGVDRDDLHKKVECFLSSMYREALVALRWDTLEKFLPKSLHQMKLACSTNNLPSKETMSAFLVVKMVEGEEQVSIPHKLLHEFYASLWIVQSLFDESCKRENDTLFQNYAMFLQTQSIGSTLQQDLLNDVMTKLTQRVEIQKPDAIRSILADLHSDDPATLRMSKYQSLLLQVAGVLYTQHSSKIKDCTAQDIVELLKESGLGHNDDNEWFELLDLVNNDSAVIKYVSRHICNSITIKEGHIRAALKLLKDARPKKVRVSINSNHRNIAEFPNLLESITRIKCKVELYFHHDFQHPGLVTTDDNELQAVVERCEVLEFLGNLSGEAVSLLPNNITFLNLVVSSDNHAASLFSHLQVVIPKLPLVGLCLHITCGVSASDVTQVPASNILLWLLLTDVEDDNMTRACDIVCNLLNSDSMFMDIRFPRANVSVAGWEQLLERLQQSGVHVGHISIPEDAE
ncbi:NACHT, LRR and PYD domains-containing protein 10-like 8, partial [Homarus americanus]